MPERRRYLLTGLVACGTCGRRMESAWSHGRPAYRCRHGHTSAVPPGPDRPGNAYVREDRIVPRLPAVHLLLTGPDPGARRRRRGRDRLPARARDHSHLRSGRGDLARGHRRSRKDHHREGKLNPGLKRTCTGRRRKKERRPPGASGSLRPGDDPACPKIGRRGDLTCPRLEPGNAGNFPESGKFPWTEHNGRRPRVPGISRSVPLPGPGGGRCPGRAAPGTLGRSPAVTVCAVRRVRAREISADRRARDGKPRRCTLPLIIGSSVEGEVAFITGTLDAVASKKNKHAYACQRPPTGPRLTRRGGGRDSAGGCVPQACPACLWRSCWPAVRTGGGHRQSNSLRRSSSSSPRGSVRPPSSTLSNS
jgi:hypothetical protein